MPYPYSPYGGYHPGPVGWAAATAFNTAANVAAANAAAIANANANAALNANAMAAASRGAIIQSVQTHLGAVAAAVSTNPDAAGHVAAASQLVTQLA